MKLVFWDANISKHTVLVGDATASVTHTWWPVMIAQPILVMQGTTCPSINSGRVFREQIAEMGADTGVQRHVPCD